MEPSIGRSIRQGFLVANRAWAGIGVFAGCSMALMLVMGFLIAFTSPPAELFQQPPTALPTVPTPRAASTSTPDTAKSAALSPETAGTNPSAQATTPVVPATTETQATARQEEERRMRVIGDWIGRAWPMLLVCTLLFILVKVWLTGAQIGYVVARVKDPRAKLATFFGAGARAFWSLLRGWLLMGAAFMTAMLSMLLVILILGGLSRVLPGWVIGLAAVLLTLALFVGVIWLSVRLILWFIAVVVDGLGPMDGLRASFRTTRGVWWPLAGLGMLLGAISLGAGLLLILGEAIGNAIGGAGGVILTLAISLAYLVLYFYVLFVATAAFVQWYLDAKDRTPIVVSTTS